ncbi:MAG: hypothetical protein LBV79_07625 [Candidatus Adiutrix sp.]|jgi:hypothetical protein|nr:hypothetical protein [Candidatus Adiutrix sp.]
MQCDIKQYWDLTDGDVDAVYQHAVREKLLDRILYDAASSRALFQLFARQAECFCAVYAPAAASAGSAGSSRGFGRVPSDSPARPAGRNAGFFYLSHFEGATARLHLALAGGEKREAAPPALGFARQILDWCFATFEFKSLLTVSPAADESQARLWVDLGAAPLAEVPGLCWLEKQKKTAPGRVFIVKG